MPVKKLKVKDVKKKAQGPVKSFIPASAPSKSRVRSNEVRAVRNPKTFATPRLNSSSASELSSRTAKAQKIMADVYDTKGKVVETIKLPAEIFGAKINKKLIAQAVRVYLANQRRGTSSTKSRGEVQGSSRKIYRQKGTGRARHGSLRAPIFVHGGIAFGPKPRDYSLEMPKKMKKAALFSALSSKVKDGELKIVAGLEKITPKTKKMVEIIKNLDLNNQKLLIVLPERDENIDRAARNIEGLNMIMANQLNTYEVLNCRALLLTKDSIELMSKSV